MCETCDQCDEDKDEKIQKFVKDFHGHGLGCGLEISKLAREKHPDAIAIVPLYRSCIVVEQSDEDKKEGVATIHAYADPHWMGGDITIETLRSDDFHTKFVVQGLRHGPEICMVNANTYQKTMREIKE